MNSDWPIGLAALVEEGVAAVALSIRAGRLDTFVVHLADWRLNLPTTTPCIWLKSEMLAQRSAEKLIADIKIVVQRQEWHNVLIFVFVDGPTDELAAALGSWSRWLVLFDASDQQAMQTAVSAKQIAITQIIDQLGRLPLSPYDVHKPVLGNAFFGRQQEIADVLNFPATSYLFVGIRRIGKTSLLKELKRRLDQIDPPRRGQMRRVYIDCNVITTEQDFLRTLTFQLEQSGYTLVSSRSQDPELYREHIIDHYTAVHGSPITFLLDEFDRLLNHLQSGWPLMRVIQTAVASGQIRLLAAGYRLSADATTNEQSPFYSILTPVWLKPLSQTAVYQMLTEPFHQLGLRLDQPEAFATRIFEETNGLPNYVQHYCKSLFAQAVWQPDQPITEEMITAVHQQPDYLAFLLNTFMANADLVEQTIVYALTLQKIDELERGQLVPLIETVLQQNNLFLTEVQIERACRNLETAGVFKSIGTRYVFAVPYFQTVLRRMRDVSFLFEKAREALQSEKIMA